MHRPLLAILVSLAGSALSALLIGAAATADTVFESSSFTPPRSEGLFGVLHGLYWLTVNASSRTPLVLAIDDLQYCDTGSLRYLAYLLRRLEGMPVLIVGTLRTGDMIVCGPASGQRRVAPFRTARRAALNKWTGKTRQGTFPYSSRLQTPSGKA